MHIVGPGIIKKKTEKSGKWDTYTVSLETYFNMSYLNMTCNMARNTEKRGKWEMPTVDFGRWR